MNDNVAARMNLLPLQESMTRGGDRNAFAVRVHRVSPYENMVLDPLLNEDLSTVEEYDVTKRDLRQIYISLHAYNYAFEEELNLSTYNYDDNPTAGMVLENRDGRLILTDMSPGAPGHRIRCSGGHV